MNTGYNLLRQYMKTNKHTELITWIIAKLIEGKIPSKILILVIAMPFLEQ